MRRFGAMVPLLVVRLFSASLNCHNQKIQKYKPNTQLEELKRRCILGCCMQAVGYTDIIYFVFYCTEKDKSLYYGPLQIHTYKL